VLFLGQYNYGQSKNVITPENLYSSGISDRATDSIYRAGWNECLDSLKARRFCYKSYGFVTGWYRVWVEILKNEFEIDLIGGGCVLLHKEKIFWSGFNDCIESYTKEKYGMDVFKYSSDLAEASVPKSEFLNRDSVMAQLKFPSTAKMNGIRGKVYVEGLLDKDGALQDLKIAKGLGYGCDEEALRLAKMLRFPPAKNTKYARALGLITIPILFKDKN
ncbi:MAG: energy transducer TonB, partial [Bacteroidota bacterium]|nr:energy transducer TonB [Bacteroidota bacterium]